MRFSTGGIPFDGLISRCRKPSSYHVIGSEVLFKTCVAMKFVDDDDDDDDDVAMLLNSLDFMSPFIVNCTHSITSLPQLTVRSTLCVTVK